MTSLKRSFKDKAKEKLGFGGKSKHHSVDVDSLGIMNPLSWDNLSSDIREKLSGEQIGTKSAPPQQGQTFFPSLPSDRLSSYGYPPVPGAVISNTQFYNADMKDQESDHNEVNKTANRKSRLIQPVGTVQYAVRNHDTLTSLAAQYDTTPSELCKLNKLSTRFIFPGQVLYVPDQEYYSSGASDSCGSGPTSPMTSSPAAAAITLPSTGSITSSPAHLSKSHDIPIVRSSAARHPSNSPKSPLSPPKGGPGVAERVETMTTGEDVPLVRPLSEAESEKLDRECLERFIKINVKHITDGQGVVSGTLLVTPNAIMFDPNVSDLLVIERGAETYGMIAPMDTVISVAMYHDIAAMKLKSTPKETLEKCAIRHEVYHSPNCPVQRRPVTQRPISPPARTDQVPTTQEEPADESTVAGSALSLKPPELESSNSSSEGLHGMTDEGLHDLESELTDNKHLVADCAQDGGGNFSFSKTVTFSDHVTDIGTGNGGSETGNGGTGNVEARQRALIEQVKATRRYDSQDHGIAFLERLEDPEPRKSEPGDRSSGIFTMPFSPNFSSFVDFSSGLFSASKDDRSKVKDITEVETREPPTEVKELSTTLEKETPPVYFSPNTLRRLNTIMEHGLVEREQEDRTQGRTREHGTRAPKLSSKHRSQTYSGRQASHQHVSHRHFITVGAGASASWLSSPLQKISETMSGSPKAAEDEENKPQRAEVAVESLVKMGDRPDLFQSLDDLIPKPAQHYEDPPLYLCLKVGVPINKRMSMISHIDTNKKKKKPEYWFSIPRDRVDNLYAFFIQWSPSLYGGEDEIDPKERGFVVIEDDEQDEDEVQVDFVKGRLIRSMSKDWEILNVAEARRRMSILDVEESLPLPDLHGETAILTEEHVATLTKILPARAEGYPWTLIYSSDQNGFSLSTIFRTMQGYDCPVLLVIKDTANNVFGALTSCPIKYSEHFYGTGESFLYSFYPEFKVYSWSGDNSFFIKGNKDGLAIGSGKGSFGIWVDGDLYHGRTQHCDTYNNEPLTSQEDFVIKGFEAWGFF